MGKYPILDEITVPESVLEDWQLTADLLAQIAEVPAALVMRVHQREIEVLVASRSAGNIYHRGEMAPLDTGLYCEAVLGSRKELRVPNALKDPTWAHNPDLARGMLSYCGLPLTWPTGEVFGTLCILDAKEDACLEQTQHLMQRFRDSIQLSLVNLYAVSLTRRQRDEAQSAPRESDDRSQRDLDTTQTMIKSAETELEQYRDHLEQLVAPPRTRELASADPATGVEMVKLRKVEEELAAFNRNFEAFLDQTSDFIYFKDINSRFIFCSQTLAAVTGHRNWREMVGKHDREVFPPDTAKIYEEEETPVLSEGKPLLDKIDPYYDAAGRAGYVQTNKWPLFDARGKVVGIFGISRDITERLQVVAALQASEARLKEAQALAQLGSWEMSLTTNQLNWSDEIYRIFEIDPAQFASYERFIAAVHPDDRAAVNAAYQALVVNKTPYSIEHRLLLPDGRLKWVAQRGRTDDDASGKALRSRGTVQDISARMEAKEALRASQQRLGFHLEHMPIAAIEWSLDFTVTAWNPAATTIFGYSREEALGRKGSFILPPGEREAVDRTWTPLHAASSGRRSINENVCRDGTVIICEWFNTTLRDSEGRAVGMASLAQDITARRRLQDTLEHVLARTRRLSERLVAIQEEERRMIAHELHDEVGQGLTAAKIHLQAMERIARGHAAFPMENLREALAAVAHTLEQVRSLSLDMRPMQLDDLGLAVALGALLERNAAATGWVAHYDPAVGLDRIESGLALACYRVAQESLTNIMRHAAASEVWVRLVLRAGELELFVRDDGTGFDSAAVAGHGGAPSLGLLGMEERVRSRGGRIEIRSATGQGTQVSARFPLCRPAAEERQ